MRRYILLLSFLLTLLGTAVRGQSYVAMVCAGDTGIAFRVDGWETSTFDWNIEGGTITRQYGDSIIVDWKVEPGEYQVTVQEISDQGCVGELMSAIVLVAGPDIDIGEDTYVCEGEVIEITPEGDFDSYLWHDGSTSPSYSTNQEGWISVEVTDAYGCAASDSLYLSVQELPRVDLGNDTTLCGLESLVLDAGPDGEFYTWSTGDMDQVITVYPQGDQEIWVIAEDAFGCTDGDTIIIEACDVQFYLRDIPSAITPNDDGKNDYWEIDKLTGFDQVVIEIFSQWGTLIWRSEPGYSVSWDGRDMNGKLVPVDSYHYVIDLNDGTNERYIGYVTVIR